MDGSRGQADIEDKMVTLGDNLDAGLYYRDTFNQIAAPDYVR